jgi:hypothetical protein
MRHLSALFAAALVLGFAGSVAAQCAGYGATAAQQTAQAPVVLPEGAAGS